MLRRSLPALLAVAALASCTATESPTDLLIDDPLFAISDGATGGNDHFFFLPPMVSAPTYSGTFDPALEPAVTICELAGGACGTVIATFTTTTGPGSETVRAEAADEHYIVNWHADDFELDASITYRISVSAEGQELGFADVDVVNSGKELKNVETGEFIALKDGRTLPIKFRVEDGAINLDPCLDIQFADAALEAAVRTALGIPTDPITSADVVGLTQLFAIDQGITDLSGLECLTGLTSLNLSRNAITDLTPLTPLTNLVLLNMSGATQAFPDLQGLSGMTSLEVLNLGSVSSFSSIAPLAGLTSMTALTLVNAPLGGDISALTNMGNLTTVQLDNVGATDISVLADKTALRFLRMNGNQIGSLAPLTNLTALQFLFLRDATFTDLSPLAGLTNLEILFLTTTSASDLSPLSTLTNLVNLNLADSPSITDISPLGTLTNLVTLGLRSNLIGGDVSALAGMPQLVNLTATNVGLTSLAFVSANPLLQTLRVGLNNISDASPLLGSSDLALVVITGNPITCSDADLQTLIGNGVSVSCDP